MLYDFSYFTPPCQYTDKWYSRKLKCIIQCKIGCKITIKKRNNQILRINNYVFWKKNYLVIYFHDIYYS